MWGGGCMRWREACSLKCNVTAQEKAGVMIIKALLLDQSGPERPVKHLHTMRERARTHERTSQGGTERVMGKREHGHCFKVEIKMFSPGKKNCEVCSI